MATAKLSTDEEVSANSQIRGVFDDTINLTRPSAKSWQRDRNDRPERRNLGFL